MDHIIYSTQERADIDRLTTDMDEAYRASVDILDQLEGRVPTNLPVDHLFDMYVAVSNSLRNIATERAKIMRQGIDRNIGNYRITNV